MLGLAAAYVATNANEFGEFAITFTLYTITLSFFRPIVSDALINKDLFEKSNGREYVRDAFLISLLMTLICISLYLFIPQFRNSLMILLLISLPTLLMHDAIRFKMLSFQLNKSLALMDSFWTLLFLSMSLGLFLSEKQNPTTIFLAWTFPTLLTTISGVLIIYKQEPGVWMSSWIVTSRPIWKKIFREFLFGPGLIQIIFLISIAIFDSTSISSFRLSITLLFPLTLLTSTQVLEIFNFGKWNSIEANSALESNQRSRQNQITTVFVAIYLLFIFISYKEIISAIAPFQFNFNSITLILLSAWILLSMAQVNLINFLKKNNQYSKLVRIRVQLLPLIMVLLFTLGAIYSFNGVLLALNTYSAATLLLNRRFRYELNKEYSILIATEENSGGAFLAAKNHFESLSRVGTRSYFVFPGFSNHTDKATQVPDLSTRHIHSQNFPSSIGNLRESFTFMRNFRRLWLSLNRPNLFAHGIRSGFLMAICCLRRPDVLIHRDLQLKLPVATRIILRFHRFLFHSIHSVAPLTQGFKGIGFYPILSPNLTNYVSKPRISKMGPSDALRIIWVGRFDFPKNPEALLIALSNFDTTTYECKMIGQGPRELECKVTSDILRLNVKFQPFGSVMDELQESDVMVLISEFEGIPFVLQEALAAGVGVICSKLPGIEFLGGNSFDYVSNHDELFQTLTMFMNPIYLAKRQEMVQERWEMIQLKFHSNWDLTDDLNTEGMRNL